METNDGVDESGDCLANSPMARIPTSGCTPHCEPTSLGKSSATNEWIDGFTIDCLYCDKIVYPA